MVVAKIWSETPLDRAKEEVDFGLGNLRKLELDELGVGGLDGSAPVDVGCVVLTGDVDFLET